MSIRSFWICSGAIYRTFCRINATATRLRRLAECDIISIKINKRRQKQLLGVFDISFCHVLSPDG